MRGPRYTGQGVTSSQATGLPAPESLREGLRPSPVSLTGVALAGQRASVRPCVVQTASRTPCLSFCPGHVAFLPLSQMPLSPPHLLGEADSPGQDSSHPRNTPPDLHPHPHPPCGALQAAGRALKGTSTHAGPLSSRDMPGHTGSVFTRLTHAHTWTHSAAPKLVPLHPEDWVLLSHTPAECQCTRVCPDLALSGSVTHCRPRHPWPLTPQGADSARGPSPALSAETLSRPHKGDGPWPGGGGAGPLGTDLPGPGGRAGTGGGGGDPAGLPS